MLLLLLLLLTPPLVTVAVLCRGRFSVAVASAAAAAVASLFLSLPFKKLGSLLLPHHVPASHGARWLRTATAPGRKRRGGSAGPPCGHEQRWLCPCPRRLVVVAPARWAAATPTPRVAPRTPRLPVQLESWGCCTVRVALLLRWCHLSATPVPHWRPLGMCGCLPVAHRWPLLAVALWWLSLLAVALWGLSLFSVALWRRVSGTVVALPPSAH
mmetsp:Transcript_59620/g.112492  ORF Transcript_59620/g.112492 Transcript_59620/m.112492 type:complete len:213 (-) Transcript_59620:253-891(-)